jgi:hypothetical protein
LRPAWQDLDTWSRELTSSHETELGVGLHLTGEGGTVLVAAIGRLDRQAPNRPPDDVTLQIAIPDTVSPYRIRRRQLSLAVNEGLEDFAVIDLTARLAVDDPSPGAHIQNGRASMSARDFLKVVSARTITANVFGSVARLRPDQIAALSGFATRLHLQPDGPPRLP